MSNELNLTYEKNFASLRADGRYVSTMAAHMAMLRDQSPRLELPKNLTSESFTAWQKEIKMTLLKQLCLPTVNKQPPPKLLYSHQREGYRAEKWEFYPDDYTAIPFLALVPDGATADSPAPAVICCLNSCESKESVAGEPLLEHPNCQQSDVYTPFAKKFAENGMVAFVFDNPGMCECSVLSDSALGETQTYIREILCHGLLETGCGYLGLTVFQRLQFMKWLDSFSYVDQDKLAISSRGMGTEAAIIVALLDERIGTLIYGDVLRDSRRYYVAATEQNEQVMAQDVGKWHILPGRMTSFGYQDLCAAFVPRNLYLCGGSNEEFVNTVRRAYEFNKAESRLYCGSTVNNYKTLPMFGLHKDELYSSPVWELDSELSFLKKSFGIS